MPGPRDRPQIALPSELTSGSLVDRAFRVVRRLPRGEAWPGYAFVVLLAALCGAVAWTEHLQEPSGWTEPTRLRAFSERANAPGCSENPNRLL